LRRAAGSPVRRASSRHTRAASSRRRGGSLALMRPAATSQARASLRQEIHRLSEAMSPVGGQLLIINRDHLRRVERFLDRGVGACWLRRPDLAELMSNALRHFDGQRYRLSAWVVMPNHVHAVLWPMPNHLLGDILKSWKGYTAHEFNQRLQQTGQTFWQPESFDHWIRNDDEKARICRYVVHNPVPARLCATPEEWRWSSAWPGGSHPQKS